MTRPANRRGWEARRGRLLGVVAAAVLLWLGSALVVEQYWIANRSTGTARFVLQAAEVDRELGSCTAGAGESCYIVRWDLGLSAARVLEVYAGGAEREVACSYFVYPDGALLELEVSRDPAGWQCVEHHALPLPLAIRLF